MQTSDKINSPEGAAYYLFERYIKYADNEKIKKELLGDKDKLLETFAEFVQAAKGMKPGSEKNPSKPVTKNDLGLH